MRIPSTKTLVSILALTALAQAAELPATAVVVPEAKAKVARTKGSFLEWLLPKSLQKNPRLDFNIITEMTPAGRTVKPPTPQKPAYYIIQTGVNRNTGVGAEEGLQAPPPAQLQQLLIKALADGSYLVTDGAAHPPTLVVIYHWGSSSFQPPASVAPDPASAEAAAADPAGTGDVPVPEIVLRKALLDRAMLLGGVNFTREVSRAMEEVDSIAGATRTFTAPEGGSDFMASPMAGMQDPFDRLRSRSPEMERLIDELFSSSYFVVASAYDYAALAKGQRRLLWRTKMTVNSLGVNMLESVPPLIASAGPYLGRDMSEPMLVTKRLTREGRVEIGTPVVVPDNAGDATKPAAPAVKAKP